MGLKKEKEKGGERRQKSNKKKLLGKNGNAIWKKCFCVFEEGKSLAKNIFFGKNENSVHRTAFCITGRFRENWEENCYGGKKNGIGGLKEGLIKKNFFFFLQN